MIKVTVYNFSGKQLLFKPLLERFLNINRLSVPSEFVFLIKGTGQKIVLTGLPDEKKNTIKQMLLKQSDVYKFTEDQIIFQEEE